MHAIERPITAHYEDSDKSTVFGEYFTDHPRTDIHLYYPEEHDDKGAGHNVLKAGHHVLLWRTTLSSQPKKWVTMLLFAQKQMIGSCV